MKQACLRVRPQSATSTRLPSAFNLISFLVEDDVILPGLIFERSLLNQVATVAPTA